MERLRGVPQVSLPPPDGGFYAFIEVEGLRDSLAFAERARQRDRRRARPGIRLRPGRRRLPAPVLRIVGRNTEVRSDAVRRVHAPERNNPVTFHPG